MQKKDNECQLERFIIKDNENSQVAAENYKHNFRKEWTSPDSPFISMIRTKLKREKDGKGRPLYSKKQQRELLKLAQQREEVFFSLPFVVANTFLKHILYFFHWLFQVLNW